MSSEKGGCQTYMHNTRLAASEQHASSHGQSMHISGVRLQASDQLPRLQVPDIDLAVEASAVEEGAFTCQGQDGLALFSAILEGADVREQAASCWVYTPQQNAAVASSRDQHFL